MQDPRLALAVLWPLLLPHVLRAEANVNFSSQGEIITLFVKNLLGINPVISWSKTPFQGTVFKVHMVGKTTPPSHKLSYVFSIDDPPKFVELKPTVCLIGGSQGDGFYLSVNMLYLMAIDLVAPVGFPPRWRYSDILYWGSPWFASDIKNNFRIRFMPVFDNRSDFSEGRASLSLYDKFPYVLDKEKNNTQDTVDTKYIEVVKEWMLQGDCVLTVILMQGINLITYPYDYTDGTMQDWIYENTNSYPLTVHAKSVSWDKSLQGQKDGFGWQVIYSLLEGIYSAMTQVFCGVAGVVAELDTLLPLGNVTVVAVGREKKHWVTTKTGEYWRPLPPGTHVLRAWLEGYPTTERTVTIKGRLKGKGYCILQRVDIIMDGRRIDVSKLTKSASSDVKGLRRYVIFATVSIAMMLAY